MSRQKLLRRPSKTRANRGAASFGTNGAESSDMSCDRQDVAADTWLGHFEGAVRMLADGFGWQVSVDIELEGSQLPGGDATATRVVNAIARLCNAAPGVHSALDLVIAPRGS
jgi:hypothetical protein